MVTVSVSHPVPLAGTDDRIWELLRVIEGVDGRVVLVVGPHRSGTSAITRIVNLLGVDLGPEDKLIGAGAPQNLKGFFESRPITVLNDRLLGQLGGSWRDPPRLEPGWERDQALEPIRADAAQIVRASFGGASLWGFKDPRTCVTLPFWRELLGPMEYVICHRNPLEVARSLERRDGISQRQAVELWARYTASTIINTAGTRRIFVGFSELFADRGRVLTDLGAFVRGAGVEHDPRFSETVDGWLEAELKHHTLGLDLLLVEPHVSTHVRVLATALELAISARAGEPGLRGEPPVGGPAEAALDAAARSYEQARLASSRRSSRAQPRRTPATALPIAELPPAADWIIVGAPHCGAAALRALTSGHPELTAPGDLSEIVASPAPDLARLAAASAPEAKLVMLIRDPIARAIDHHRLAVAAGLERRPLERALREQLCVGALAAARRRPSLTNSYVVHGEYARLLEACLDHFPASRLLVVDADAFELDPSPVLGRVLRLIGVDDRWRPPDLRRRARLGGDPPLVAPDAARRLTDELEVSVFPLAGVRASEAHRSFAAVFESWNRSPALASDGLSADLRTALVSHFAADGARLEGAMAVRVPWSTAPASAPVSWPAPGPDEPPQTSVAVIVDDIAAAEDAVRSVRAQTEGSFELLLVDATGDRERTGLQTLAGAAGARVVAGDRAGTLAGARNAAIQEARGEELALLDSDCLVTDGWLANLRAALASASDLALVGPRSNCADGPQGGIWLEDVSPEGVARFVRSFNRPDPGRWFELDQLGAFALLGRRAILREIGGFDGAIVVPAIADRDLCARLRQAGHRLLCAGDTFVFRAARRELWPGIAAAIRDAPGGARAIGGDPGRLVEDPAGDRFELHGTVASRIASDAAMRLMRNGRPVEAAADGELSQASAGAPIALCRSTSSDSVWLLHGGARRLVTGDPRRIRRLPGVAIVADDWLAALGEGSAVSVEDALPPVAELEPARPIPAASTPRDLAPLDVLIQALGEALQHGHGYALIRIGVDEARILDDAGRPIGGGIVNGSGPSGPRPTDIELCQAIRDSDAVGLPVSDGQPPLALERVLIDHDLYPRLRFDRERSYELLGFDPDTGRDTGSAPLRDLLDGRPVAAVGRLAADAQRFADRIGYDVTLAVELDGPSELESAFLELAAERDAFDAVLVAAGSSARLLCARLARECDVVAVDLGYAFDRLLYERNGGMSPAEVEARWAAERYIRESADPPPDPAHPLEGQLIREPGNRAIFLVERAKARRVTHKALLSHLAADVVEVAPELLAELPRGLPLGVVRGRESGQPFVLVGGRRVPLRLGLPTPPVSSPAVDLLVGAPPIDWFPGARAD